MAKTIRINGTDYTSLLVPQYSYAPKKIRGPNADYMSDGSYDDDVRANKAVLTLRAQPLNSAQTQALVTAMMMTYTSVYFWDPSISAYRTMEAMPSEPQVQYRGVNSDGADVWTVQNIIFTER